MDNPRRTLSEIYQARHLLHQFKTQQYIRTADRCAGDVYVSRRVRSHHHGQGHIRRLQGGGG